MLNAIKNKILRRKIRLQKWEEEFEPFHGGETGGLSKNFKKLKKVSSGRSKAEGITPAPVKKSNSIFRILKWKTEDLKKK